MYYYVNILEDLVKEVSIHTVNNVKMCKCDKCVSDVIAYALNLLPPKYVVTDAGRMYTKLEIYKNQYSADILAAVTQACQVIRENPKH